MSHIRVSWVRYKWTKEKLTKGPENKKIDVDAKDFHIQVMR